MKGTINYGFKFGRSPPILEGYSDANWISDSNEIKSTNGYVLTLGGSVVSWKASKQTYKAQYTMESEFIILEKACSEAKWLINLLAGVSISTNVSPCVFIHWDCQAAIAKSNSKFIMRKVDIYV